MAAAAVLLLGKPKKNKVEPETVPSDTETATKDGTVADDDGSGTPETEDEKEKFKLVCNSIYLFGGFTAVTADGRNVTINFSPMQQKLFCVVLYHTPLGGITPGRLSAILWPDRQGESVKNLRNATLNHLRKALSDLQGVSVVYNGSYSIETTGEFYCDYLRFREIASAKAISYHDIEDLALLLSRGSFMESMEDVSLDFIKGNVGQMLIKSIPHVIKKLYDKRKYQDILAFCDILYHVDPFNDYALKYQISSLCRMKKSSEALVRYATFLSEYRTAYGEDYQFKFEDLQKP